MRSTRARRAACLAPILILALACCGCPELNHQPDYMGDRNALLSIPDPIVTPVVTDAATLSDSTSLAN